MEPGEPLDEVAQGEVCGRVATRVGVMGSVPTDLGEFSVSSVGGGAPRAADCGCVQEVMYCGGDWGSCHSCFSAPQRFRPSGSSALVEGGSQVPCHSGPHPSWGDLRWIHLHWPHSKAVVP